MTSTCHGLVLWDVVGIEIGRLTRCACREGADCDRPGKHPVTEMHQHGAANAVEWAQAVEAAQRPGWRLARVLHSEAVLDFDSQYALWALWRTWATVSAAPEVKFSATPRGLHVWLPGGVGALRRSRVRGIDVKTGPRQYVVWPDGGLTRHWLTPQDVEDRLTRLYPISPAGSDGLDVFLMPGGMNVDSGGDPSTGMRRRYAGDPVRRLQWLLDEVAMAPDGERNDRLNRCTWMGRDLLEVFDRDFLIRSFTRAAEIAGLERGETARTIRSGLLGGVV